MTAPWIDVSDIRPRIAYTATAGQTAFTVPFVFFGNDDLRFYKNGILLILDVHYSVTGAMSETGGTVTLATGAALSDRIMISRHVAIEQTTHVPVFGPLDVPSINTQFSKLTAIQQQLEDEFQRSLRLPDSTAVTGDMLLVTAPVAGQFLKWNATENGVESTAVILPDNVYSIATPSEAAAGTSNSVLMTPLRVRQIDTADTSYVNAYWAGVVSTNTAAQNSTALAAIIAALPGSGSRIDIQGQCPFNSELNIQDRRNVMFTGRSDVNSGASSASRLVWTGTGAGNAVNAQSTQACGFDGCDLANQNGNTGFTGTLLNFDRRSGGFDTGSCFFRNAMLSTGITASDAIVGMSLDGTTGPSFYRTCFIGRGAHVLGVGATAGFSNSVSFRDCLFNPVNSWPVLYPGANWSFEGGYAQAGSADGVGRFIVGSGARRFDHLVVANMGLYDCTAPNTVWLQGLSGKHLHVHDNLFGCYGLSYAMILASVQGIVIENNNIPGVDPNTILVGFDTPAAGQPVSNYGRIWFNEINTGYVVGSLTSESNQIDIDFNFLSPGGNGTLFVQKPFNGPTAAPTTSKSLWRDAAASNVIKGVA